MSWQRIFEFARRRRLPMVVTDIAGREPFVILPLDTYEQMLDGGVKAGEEPSVVQPRDETMRKDIVRNVPTIAPSPGVSSTQATAVEKSSLVVPEERDLSLEERFYLEPIEDEGR